MIPQQASVAEPATCDLQRLYDLRFRGSQEYRRRVWKILTQDFFQPLIPSSSHVLDLGCGWGEFINQIDAALKYAMDLNPESRQRLAPNIHFIEQDCSAKWPLDDRSLDVVFSSNFFEHLRAKDDLYRTLGQVRRCLKPGGRLICMGPNIKYLPGRYWDFWDHYLPLTEQSLREVLEVTGFEVERCIAKFVPYQMVRRGTAPLLLIRLYLKLPWTWHFFGQQFLVIARA
jgi:SAM-dependent methyltransferase